MPGRAEPGSSPGKGSALAGLAATHWSHDLRRSRVYDEILLGVILGDLAPGQRLEEQSLAQRYGAGLAGVRDALGRLALEGLVIRKARASTSVARFDIEELIQATEVRALLEPRCAELAARNASQADLEELSRAFDGAAEAVRRRDFRAIVVMDQRFHAAVAHASGNPTLASIIVPLQYKATRFWIHLIEEESDEERIGDISRHADVAAQIAKGDAERARAAMLEMVEGFGDRLREMARATARNV
jgi:DNA-binding GntR family transcriptional regulator